MDNQFQNQFQGQGLNQGQNPNFQQYPQYQQYPQQYPQYQQNTVPYYQTTQAVLKTKKDPSILIFGILGILFEGIADACLIFSLIDFIFWTPLILFFNLLGLTFAIISKIKISAFKKANNNVAIGGKKPSTVAFILSGINFTLLCWHLMLVLPTSEFGFYLFINFIK